MDSLFFFICSCKKGDVPNLFGQVYELVRVSLRISSGKSTKTMLQFEILQSLESVSSGCLSKQQQISANKFGLFMEFY